MVHTTAPTYHLQKRSTNIFQEVLQAYKVPRSTPLYEDETSRLGGVGCEVAT